VAILRVTEVKLSFGKICCKELLLDYFWQMNTLVCQSPGRFEYLQQDLPLAEPGHAIIRIRQVGVCGTDLHAFEGTQPFFSYPRILGHELAGEFVSGDAPGFIPGDRLTVIPYYHCGTCIACRQGKTNCCASLKVTGVHVDGGMRDYLSVPSYTLVKSDGLNDDQLALVEPLSIGAHAVRRSGMRTGDWVLVVGAGPIGLGIIQFAQQQGAKVMVMDTQEHRLAFCAKVLGCEHLINPQKVDAMQVVFEMTGGEMPAVVMDATGNRDAINNAFRYMAHAGVYVLVGLQLGEISFSHPEFHKREGTLMSSRNATREDFMMVMESIRTGRINPLPMITHRLSFAMAGDHFSSLMDPANKVVKAMIHLQ
jgi:2-desacetyl-2-hydroxyethyl bacteriochlorophyllide A dehydrogenase